MQWLAQPKEHRLKEPKKCQKKFVCASNQNGSFWDPPPLWRVQHTIISVHYNLTIIKSVIPIHSRHCELWLALLLFNTILHTKVFIAYYVC